MTLKLEVGKAYVTRDGEVYDCVALDYDTDAMTTEADAAWCVNRKDGHRGLFRLDGNYTFVSDYQSNMDLVKEFVE